MSRLALNAMIAALVVASPAMAADVPCAPGPMPAALDSVPALELNAFANVIAFAATPSLDYPGRSWVVRAWQPVRGQAATLEILLLRRRDDCNRYDVEKRWNAVLTAEEYRGVAAKIAPLATPPTDTFSNDDPLRLLEGVALDGTGLDLRASTGGWQVARTLNHYSKGGEAISAVFRSLAARHVPASEMPVPGRPEWSAIT